MKHHILKSFIICVSLIDAFGLVQGVCGAPNFDHPGTATEGESFFLLMEAAYNDLTK